MEETIPQAAKARPASPQNPTASQLRENRSAHWHQNANPLLSQEALREWLQRSGLVLYAPKPLGAPAPTLVEATLGVSKAELEVGDHEAAKTLLTRLIAEGSAVPLNLLGATGGLGSDTPDFVVSAAVFSYIFTLRGNKAWKQSPVTSGPVKVSPLALATYELLSAKITMSAYDLTTQLGKEVTETAVLRALTELWSQLRVLPVPQQDGSATLWELASGRFTKQIKAGANAGQPSALSALISLYLGQAITATEDEIESFLSPLAARSRVRDVVHALMSARQLDTLVIDGKTLLHVAGEMPSFPGAKPGEPEAPESGDSLASDSLASEEQTGSRIGKFAAKPGSKIGTGLRARPSFAKKPGFTARPGGRPGARPGNGAGPRPSFGAKPSFGRSAPAGDRERRPFQKRDEGAGSSRPASSTGRPAFDKPWSENGPPRREFNPAAEGATDRPKRTFSKPGTFGRKREVDAGSAGAGRSFAAGRDRGNDRSSSEGRPPRRDFAAGRSSPERSERPAPGGFKRPGSYTPRPSGGAGFDRERPAGGSRPPFQAKPRFDRDRSERPAGAEGSGDAPKRVFRKFDAPRSPRPSGAKPSFGPRSAPGFKPSFGSRPASAGGGGFPRDSSSAPRPFTSDRPRRSFDGAPRPGAGSSDRGSRPRQEGRPGAGRPSSGQDSRGPGAKRPGPGAGFAAKGGPFAKFADGKKPFRKPGAPRKPEGGFAPTRRKRDEDGK